MSKQKKSSSLEDYYQSCSFPKPAPAKKKKLLYNGYKDKPERRCHYTGRPGAERHEIFGGPNRQISIREGFQVDLCPELHKELHANQTEWAKRENLYWRQRYQRKYEEKLMNAGVSAQDARKVWLRLIGKNFL